MELRHLGSTDFKPSLFSFGVQQDCFAATHKVSVLLYDLADMEPLKVATTHGVGREVYLATNSRTHRVASCLVAASNGFDAVPRGYNISVCDFASNRVTGLQAPTKKFRGTAGTSIAAFSPSGRVLAALRDWDKQVLFFDIDSALGPDRRTTPVAGLRCHEGNMSGLSWSPDAKWLVLRGSTGMQVWRFPNGDDPEQLEAEEVNFRPEVNVGSTSSEGTRCAGDLAFSPDGDQVALVSASGFSASNVVIRLYDLPRQELVAESAKLKASGMKIVFSPDGTRLFSGDKHGIVAEWRPEAADRPDLVVVDSAVIGSEIVALDVDPSEQVLLLASKSRSTKGLDVHVAVPAGAAVSAEEYAARCADRGMKRREAQAERRRADEELERRNALPPTFNPAPGWPAPPPGWVPPVGWQPDPSWPPAPKDWQFWVSG